MASSSIGNAGLSSQQEIITCMDPSLYKAAAEGDIDAFKKREHLDLLLTPNKNTVLHIHITAQYDEMESTDFVEKILNMCPSLLLQANAKDETLLHMAARYGRSVTVKFLIERAKAPREEELEGGVGAARQMIRITNKEKDTALHEAVRFNQLDVVKLLTEEDPDFSYSANDAGETPLYLAAERGFGDVVSQILHACTSPALGGPNGRTSLHAAVIGNEIEVAGKILEVKGAPGLAKEADRQGWTPLHYAAHLGYASMVQLLLKYDISAAYFQDIDGKRTALHIAANGGHSNVMKELISCCPDCCELVDNRGRNVLHFAVETTDEKAVEVVLKDSSLTNLLNEKDNDGNTPLHLLANSNCWSTYISHPKVDKMAMNKENLSALDISSANHTSVGALKRKMVKDLKKAGAKAGRRNVIYKDAGEVEKESDNNAIKGAMEAKEAHLIVVTLIATVTFTAGITLPGGYISDKGPDQGTAILTREAAFRAFVITDTIALVLSAFAVFIHLFLVNPGTKRNLFLHFILAFYLTVFSLVAMVVAFITGLYAVLEHSSLGLAVATSVIGCFSFFFYYLLNLENEMAKQKYHL